MSSCSYSTLWTTHKEYTSIQMFDEESNKPLSLGYSGSSRARFRLLDRIIRPVFTLLILGSLAQLIWQSIADSTPPVLETPLDLSELGMARHIDINWSQYAYTQYVTDSTYLCNSLMIFESLHRLGSKAERLMMYPQEWSIESESSDAGLLRKARDDYNVKLQPVQIQRLEGDITWGETFTKLLAFNQTQYRRVISLDSDGDVLQTMDELFFLPHTPVAMPRAYWLDDIMSSQLMVIEPSPVEFERIQHAFAHRKATDFDMEIMNDLYGEDCLVLAHQKYNLITGEFRSNLHHRYLRSMKGSWDARRALEEAKYMHFSDWPYPKPWAEYSHVTHDKLQPACEITLEGEEDCSSRDVWDEIYDEFLARRQRVCGSRYMPD